MVIALGRILGGRRPSPLAYGGPVYSHHLGPGDERDRAEAQLRQARDAGERPNLRRPAGLGTVARVWIIVVAAAALWALVALALVLIF